MIISFSKGLKPGDVNYDINKDERFQTNSRVVSGATFWFYVVEMLMNVFFYVVFVCAVVLFDGFQHTNPLFDKVWAFCGWFIDMGTYPIFLIACISNIFTLLVKLLIFGPLLILVWSLLLSYWDIKRLKYLEFLMLPLIHYGFVFCALFYIQSTYSFINYLCEVPELTSPGVDVLVGGLSPQLQTLRLDYTLTKPAMSLNAHLLTCSQFYVFNAPRLSQYFMCGADVFGLLFVGLTILIIYLCLLIVSSLALVEKYFCFYINLLLIILFLLNIVFLTPNLVVFFIAFESLLIPIIFLISIWGSPNKRQATNYLIFYTSIGAIPIIVAILYLRHKVLFFYNVNFFTLSLMSFSWTEQQWLFLALFFSFAIKTPIVPVHIWLPKAHVDAPTTGSVILAGLLLKIGLFGFIRFLIPIFPLATIFFSPFIAIIASIGVLYASLITLWQIDIKRIIAYSSVAHINIALVSLCTLTKVGSTAAVFIMLSHGLISSALFFLVGFLYNRFHQRTVFYYGGLGTVIPVFTIFFFFFSLANIAFPLTSGFISEFLCLLSIVNINYFLGIINAFSMVLTTGYSILLFGRLCLDNPKPWLVDLIEHSILSHQVRSRDKHFSDNAFILYIRGESNSTGFDLMGVEVFILLILSCFVCFFGIVPVDLVLLIENNIDMSVLEGLLQRGHMTVLEGLLQHVH